MKLSVITTNLNNEKYIKETLLSVLTQVGSFDLEYIIVDAYSTDSSWAIIKSIIKKQQQIPNFYREGDTTIIAFQQKDSNTAEGINNGMKKATGDLICILNSDDVFSPLAISEVCKIFESKKPDFIIGKYKHINSSGKEIEKYIALFKNISVRLIRYFPGIFYITNIIPQQASFWSKNVVKNIGFLEEGNPIWDYEWFLRMLQKGYKPIFSNFTIASWRIHKESQSAKNYKKYFRIQKEIASRYTKNKTVFILHNLFYSVVLFVYKFTR